MNTNNTKIAFFDIDGTIYLYGKGVPDDTKSSIKKFRENGNIAVICTGRTKNMIFPEILDIGFDGIIAGAGTYVDCQGAFYKYILPEEISWSVVSDMKKNKIIPVPEGIENIFFDKKNIPSEYRKLYDHYMQKIPEHVKDIDEVTELNVSKLSGMMTDLDLGAKFIEKYKDRFNIVFHSKEFIEMIPNEFSKARGIDYLIEKLEIPIEDTYAFGDGMNDYEMLKYVKYGVAMGNASEDFKNKIKYVTEDYDKGGISKALRRFGLI